jgi:extracellular solute-binding protein (family 5)
VRWSLERLLTRGLVEEDANGVIVPSAAGRFEYSADSQTVTFHLRRDLRFTNGARCASADFRAAMERGLARTDHATTAWALAAVRGVQAVRGGRALPPLGILTPDDSTLVLELARRDPLLLRKLAIPGIAIAWAARDSGAGWKGAAGLGPYRVLVEDARRLLLVRGRTRRGDPSWPDTIHVRFESGAPRLRAALRAGRVDLLWPVPATMTGDALPEPYRRDTAGAAPARRLTLVMRADVPPTTKIAARRALAHGLDRSEVTALLGAGARDPVTWWAGAPPFDFPRLDASEVGVWLDRGRLGRSFHVVMLLDAEGVAPAVARSLQGEWARLNLSVDLMPLRGAALAEEALRGWRAQLILAERQALIDDPGAELAGLVMPARGPAVGPMRTGWRTREFDPWILPGPSSAPLDLDRAGRRLAEELVALPIADLDWVWIERQGSPKNGLHPHFGPETAPSITRAAR